MSEENPTPAGQITDLPEWAQTVIRDLRTENAAHRKAKKDVEDQLSDLGLKLDAATSELDEHKQTLATKDTELSTERFGRLRDRLAAERGIPTTLAERVNATDEESLTIALDALAAFRGNPTPEKPTPDPAQAAEPIPDENAAKEAFARELFKLD